MMYENCIESLDETSFLVDGVEQAVKFKISDSEIPDKLDAIDFLKAIV